MSAEPVERDPSWIDTIVLYIYLKRKGVVLRIERGLLRWSAPFGVLTFEDIALIKSHHDELIEGLAPEDVDP